MILYKIVDNRFEGFYDTSTQLVEPDFEVYFPITQEEFLRLDNDLRNGLNIIYTGEGLISSPPTEQELWEKDFYDRVDFYNEELNFASKAHVEYACGIIQEESFNEVADYLKAIDPYVQFAKFSLSEIKRPEVLKRYK